MVGHDFILQISLYIPEHRPYTMPSLVGYGPEVQAIGLEEQISFWGVVQMGAQTCGLALVVSEDVRPVGTSLDYVRANDQMDSVVKRGETNFGLVLHY